ncbi:MAG: haloacid dehalogenase type II [Burkholderiales bacterium]
MPPHVSAVVFDAYGTLFDVHTVAAECESCFPGAGSQFSQAWRAKQLQYTWLRSLMGRYCDFEAVTRDAARATARALSLILTERSLGRLMAAYDTLTPFPEVRQALAGLQGFRRAILSNGSPRMLGAVVRNAGLDELFDRVMSVDEVQIFKPHPSVYSLACDAFDVPADQIVFVSSNFWDASGAASYGFRSFWINRAKSQPEELGYAPASVLGSLNELAPALA